MKYLLLTLLTLGCFTLSAQEASADKVFESVDGMPLFPGATDKGDSGQKMLEFVYENVKYPSKAREAAVEGMVVVKFVVEKDGSMSNIEIVRDPGSQLGLEGYHVARLMQDVAGNWTPGMDEGRNVRVAFKLPIKFKLNTK